MKIVAASGATLGIRVIQAGVKASKSKYRIDISQLLLQFKKCLEVKWKANKISDRSNRI